MRLVLTTCALACVAVPLWLIASRSLPIQVAVGTAGSAFALAGLGIVRALVRRRRGGDRAAGKATDVERFLASAAFFLVSVGAVAMLAGVGIYH